jgi:hypothetical protein
MAHARPFSTSTVQDLSNIIKNTSRRGVLALVIEFQIFRSPGGLGSPGGLPSPHFGSVSVILTLLQSGITTIGAKIHWIEDFFMPLKIF